MHRLHSPSTPPEPDVAEPARPGRPDPTRLSKLMAHALRHEPDRYDLVLDAAGWVPTGDLLAAIREKGGAWARVTEEDLADVVATSAKRRFELDGDHIRALYGHTVPGRIVKERGRPPEVLFHGTSPQAWEEIRVVGLAPMGRQYVHLATDTAMAAQVGRRKTGQPVLLRVRAGDADRDGVAFYCGNERVWLADRVPAAYLEVAPG